MIILWQIYTQYAAIRLTINFYPHDIYLNGDQYYEWMNEMIDTYASRNPDNQ